MMPNRWMWLIYRIVGSVLAASAVFGQEDSNSTSTSSSSAAKTPSSSMIDDLFGNFSDVMNATNATSKPAEKKKDELHNAPAWVIVLIVLCYIHLTAGVILANLTRIKRSRAFLLGKMKSKGDRIITTGVPPKMSVVGVEIQEMATAREVMDAEAQQHAIDAKLNEPSSKAPSTGVASAGSHHAGTLSVGTTSSDTMKGVPVVPGDVSAKKVPAFEKSKLKAQ